MPRDFPRTTSRRSKRLTRRSIDKWLYDLLVSRLQELRTPGRLQQLLAVAERDMPLVFNAILRMEHRLARKAAHSETPWTPDGQGYRGEIQMVLAALCTARPRRLSPGEFDESDESDGSRQAA